MLGTLRGFRPSRKGGLAQLVERLLCKQNVNGSNPLTSTILEVVMFSMFSSFLPED